MPITYYPTFKNSSGNVGIGTISPGYRLDIKAATTNGSTAFVIRNANDANNFIIYDNGTASAGSDFRAPIFYDTNNTAYYVDPASTSIVNAFKVYDTLYFGDYTTYLSQSTPYLRITTANGYGNFGPANSSWFHMTTDRPNFYMAVGLHVNGDLFIYNTQSQLTSTSVRAPIFYDSGDTTYYLDPANTGTALAIAGNAGVGTASPTLSSGKGIHINSSSGHANLKLQSSGRTWELLSTTGAYFSVYDTTGGADRLSVTSGGNVGVATTTADTNLQVVGHVHIGNQTTFENTGGWNKTIYLDGAIHARMRILGSAYASGKNSATETSIWVDNSVSPYSGLDTNAGSFRISAGFTTLTNSARSPIFYDSDDTGYYCDPNSTSKLQTINLISNITHAGNAYIQTTTTGTAYTSHFQFREASGGISNTSEIYAPSIGFHWAGVVASNILLESSGRIAIRNNPGSGYENFIAAIVYAGSSLQAPIFYDSDNTSYYVNPASSSNVNNFTIAGTLSTNNIAKNATGSPITINSGSDGSTGLRVYYDMQLYNTLFFTDSSWNNQGRIFGSSSVVTIQAATTTTSFVKYAGYSQEGGSFRAPIFYDSDNTSYYLDPASTSNLNIANLSALQINGSSNWLSSIVNSSGNKTLAYNIWQGGKKLNADEDFNNGTNSISLYNNSGGSALSITRTALSTAPNSSGYVLRISYSTATSNGTSPGFGGFYFATSSRANAVFVTRFIANIPVGRSINFQSNAYGTNATNYWLTNNVGTGKWEEYALIVMCGDSGSFSSTNFFNISGGSDISFTWDIASATVFDITNKYETVSRALTADLAVSSPIYYDKDNTSYYIDAASSSNLNTLTLNGILTTVSSGTAINFSGQSDSIGYNATSGQGTYIKGTGGTYIYGGGVFFDGSAIRTLLHSNNYSGYSTFSGSVTSTYGNFTSPGLIIGDAQYGFYVVSGNVYYKSASGGVHYWRNIANSANTMSLDNSGILTVSGNLSAPIFYDSNNTSYYLDPASTSNLNNLTVAGTMTFGTLAYVTESRRSKNSSNVDIETVTGLISPSGPTFLEIRGFCPPTMYRTTGDRPAPYGLGFGNGSESGGIMPIGAGDNLQEIMLYGANSGPTTFTFKRQLWEAATYDPSYSNYYGSSVFSINTGTGAVTASTDIRSPIFYDSNDTSYYIDAASTSVINILQFAANTAQIIGNTSSSYGSLDIRGVRNGWRGIHFNAGGNTPHLMFDGSANGGVYFETGGRWASYYSYGNNCWGFGTSTTSSAYNVYVGTGVYSGGRVDGTIFYDSNDSTYYVDPASFSLISSMGIGGLTSSNNVQMYDSYVDASSSYLQSPPLIIRKDSSATGAIDQAPVGLFIYNLNGTNNTWTKLSMGSREVTGAGNTVSIAGLAAQKTAGTNGGWATGNLHFWTKASATQITNMVAYSTGYVQSDYSFRAPIFYDSNNTSYYLDPASTSVLNALNVTTTTVASGGAIYLNGGSTYGIGTYSGNRNSAVFDTIESTGTDPLELNYYQGGPVKIGSGANGSKSLYAVGIYDNGNVVLHAGNYSGYSAFSGTISGTAINIAGNGATADPYGTIAITEPAGASNYSYYGLTRQANIGAGFGLTGTNGALGLGANSFWFGTATSSSAGVMGSAYIAFNGSYLVAVGAVDATQFRDKDNTAYYVDPASTSNLGTVYAIESYARNWFRNVDSGEGLYNETNTNHFYSDSADYWNITSPNNQLGLRLRTGGYNGTVRGYIYADTSNSVGFLNSAGNWRLRVVGDDYSLADGSSMRAQIFYDSNDTSYYTDPASTSILNRLNYQQLRRNFAASVYSGTPGGSNLVKTFSGVLVAGSANGGNSAYTVIETSIPQDNYQMGGFTINWFENYSSTNGKTKIEIAGYWNPTSNGGFIGFEYTTSNPNIQPTIRVGRNSSGNTVFILDHFSSNYTIIIARDLWLGYNSTDAEWGTGWTMTNTTSIAAYSNIVSAVLRVGPTLTGTGASGSWGISVTGSSASCTGNAATATTASGVAAGAVKTGGIEDAAVTYAKIQSISATSRVLGRITAGAGVTEELTGANIATIIGANTITNATTAASCSGNAATATTLQTARNIGGVSFNGSADINLPGVNTAGNQNTSGNAATVTDGVYASTTQTISGVKTFSSAPVATNIAKAWVHFNGTSASGPTINASYNVSSVTKNGTGDYTVNFTNALADANYVVAGTVTIDYTTAQSINQLVLAVPRQTNAQVAGSCRLACEYIHGATLYDAVAVRAVFFR